MCYVYITVIPNFSKLIAWLTQEIGKSKAHYFRNLKQII